MSDSVWFHRRQPTRLSRPWDSPSKSTGVGCHCLLQREEFLVSNEQRPGMLLGASLVARLVKILPAAQETQVYPWVGKIPWRWAWQPLQYTRLENPTDRGAWRAIVHRVTQSRHAWVTAAAGMLFTSYNAQHGLTNKAAPPRDAKFWGWELNPCYTEAKSLFVHK